MSESSPKLRAYRRALKKEPAAPFRAEPSHSGIERTLQAEEGELALIQAAPDRFTGLARFPAIEGKTWNHPVLVHDLLIVRNGEEMAAFRLAHPST